MSANVESCFSASNEKPWHGLGAVIESALTSEDALVAAGLDWKVIPAVAKYDTDKGQMTCDNLIVNYRSSDGKALGVVSDRYKIVQNQEAFAFTDALISGELGLKATYETAGSLDNGKRVWMLAKLPAHNILGDDIVPYLVFTNMHDGNGAVKVAMTPTRVVCENTLNIALEGADRIWKTCHKGMNLAAKLQEAQQTLDLAGKYMTALAEKADLLQQQKIDDFELHKLLDVLFPVVSNADDDITSKRNLIRKSAWLDLYNSKEDLQKFKGTGWGVYNAAADFESHVEPVRTTKTYKQRRFIQIVDGRDNLSKVADWLKTA